MITPSMKPGGPLSLQVAVTNRCSLHCTYCAPATVHPAESELLSYEEIVRVVCALDVTYGIGQLCLSGGDPLARPGIERLVSMLAARGVYDLALTTNGQHLERLAGPLKQAGLDRISVSLHTLNPASFAQMTGGGVLQKTLAGIEAAQLALLRPITLNVVVMRGVNYRETTGLVRFAAEKGCRIRFLELMPFGVAAPEFGRRFVSSAEVRKNLAGEFTLQALPASAHGDVRHFVVKNGCCSTIVGFNSPYSEPFRSNRRSLRLTATGGIIGDLTGPEGILVAPMLRDGTATDTPAIAEAAGIALGLKRRNGGSLRQRVMVGIGG